MTDSHDPLRLRAIDLADKHGISEDEALKLVTEHDGEGLEEALRNLLHFLRAPS